MDQSINQLGQEKNVPAPPTLEIDIRTMEGDIKSFQEKGGEVSETGIKSEYSTMPDLEQQSTGAPGYHGSEKPIFSPSEDILSQQAQNPENSGNLKFILMIAGILIAIIGLGLLGYYVIFPLIFK